MPGDAWYLMRQRNECEEADSRSEHNGNDIVPEAEDKEVGSGQKLEG